MVAATSNARPAEGSGPVTPKGSPNHTPPRSIRIPDELWHAAMRTASGRGENVSEAVNRFLAFYVQNRASQDEDPLVRQLRRVGVGVFADDYRDPADELDAQGA